MNNKLVALIFFGIIALIAGGSMAHANIEDDYNHKFYPDAVYKKAVKPSYTVEAVNSKQVIPATGNMEMAYTDLFLPGKNGLDFALTRYYTLFQSNLYEFKLVSYFDSNNVLRVRDDYNIYTVSDKHFDLGVGWAFDLPRLEFRGTELYLHDGMAGTWQMDYFDGDYWHPANSGLMQDVLLKYEPSPTYTNGQTFNDVLQTGKYEWKKKDGRVYYFSDLGLLLGIVDRFGNEIEFEYFKNSNDHYLLSEITDSLDREIDFEYDNVNNTIEVTVSDGTTIKTVTYNKTPAINYLDDDATEEPVLTEMVLSSVEDFGGRVTSYTYNVLEVKASLISRNADYGEKNYYAMLNIADYPSAGRSTYVQTSLAVTRNLGTEGVMQYYKVRSEQHYSENNVYNKFAYYYNISNTGDFDGYPSTSVSWNYTTQTRAYNNQDVSPTQQTELYTFDRELNTLKLVSESTEHKMETENTFDVYKRLLKTVNRNYNKVNNLFMKSVNNFGYDYYRNLTGVWDEQASRDSSDEPTSNEHKQTMTYHSVYNYLTSRTYKKDNATTIEETYTPSGDGKTVSRITIKENAIKKAQTDLFYDTYGNVTEERRYLGDWTNYEPTYYSFSDNVPARGGMQNGAYLTRKWTTGVKDSDGNLVAARSGNSAGEVDTVYVYDWFGNLKQQYDGQGQATTYDYDILNRITKETFPDSSYRSWTYTTSSSENSVLIRDENNNQFKLVYDKLGKLIEEIDLATNTKLMQYSYTIENDVKEVIAHDGTKLIYTYYGNRNLKSIEAKSVANSRLYLEEYAYDPAYSNGSLSEVKRSVATALGQSAIETRTYFDRSGRIVQGVRNNNGTLLSDTFAYDYVGNRVEEKSARAHAESWSESYTAKTDYDYAGRAVKITDINGDFATKVYDALGRTASVTDRKGNNALVPYSTTYQYDNLGRVVIETVPFEQIGGTTYYQINKIDYDRNGNVVRTRQTDHKPGETTHFGLIAYEYNNRDRLTKATTYDNGNPVNYTQYYHDAMGHLIRMYTGLSSPLTITGLDQFTEGADDSYSVTSYDYDRFGRATQKTDPTGGVQIFEYDFSGNLLEQTERDGSLVEMTYDGLGRVLTREVANTGDPSKSATYAYTYNWAGLRTAMTGDGVDTSYLYDYLGRLKEESESNDIVKTYTYDANDNRKTMTVKLSGNTVIDTVYTYNKLDQLYQVTENGQLAATYTYDDNGNRETLTYANGNDVEYVYNLSNRLKKLTNNNGLTKLSEYLYDYDLKGNQTEVAETVSQRISTYAYDGLSRLISEEEEVNGVAEYSKSYLYDDFNNRISLHTTGNVEQFEFSTQWNGVSESVFNSYNGFNELKQSVVGDTESNYTYNGDGLRNSKTVDGVTTEYVLDGGYVIAEIQDGNILNKYIRGADLLYAQDSGGTQSHYLFNGHGDVVQLTSATGVVNKSYRYDAFGNESNRDAQDANPFRYTSEFYDNESGLIYLRARYYDPSTARFISEDTYEGQIDNPLTLNLYTYVHNNPLIYYDPSGNCFTKWLGKTYCEKAWNATKDFAVDNYKYLANKDWAEMFLGLAQVAGGAAEAWTGGAIVVAGSETGVMVVVGGYMVVDGFSNISGGFSRIKNGWNNSKAGDEWNFMKNGYKALLGERLGSNFYNGTQIGIGLFTASGAIKQIPGKYVEITGSGYGSNLVKEGAETYTTITSSGTKVSINTYTTSGSWVTTTTIDAGQLIGGSLLIIVDGLNVYGAQGSIE